MVFSVLSISALVIFTAYVILCLCLFGVTSSLSATYYELEKIKKNLGKILFYTVLIIAGLLTIIATVDKAGVFAFFMVVGISLVAVFPEFLDKTKMDVILHPLGAGIAAIAAIITAYLLIPLTYVLILIGLVVSVVSLIALITNTVKECWVYHIEMVAFYTLFGSSVIYNLFFR